MGRCRRTRNERNIKKDEGTGEWVVYKKFKQLKKPVEYKRFKRFMDAKKYRDKLDKNNNWIKELPSNLRIQVTDPCKNYVKSGNGWAVEKTVNNIYHIYGYFDNKEDAKNAAYHLKINNWDWSKVPEHIRKTKRNNINHQYPVSEYYKLFKRIDGVDINIGVYATKEDAEKVQDWLNKNNWDYQNQPRELLKLKLTKKEPKYYNKHNGRYKVNKTVNGQTIYYGTYDTEEEAQRIVELLKKNQWNKECLI